MGRSVLLGGTWSRCGDSLQDRFLAPHRDALGGFTGVASLGDPDFLDRLEPGLGDRHLGVEGDDACVALLALGDGAIDPAIERHPGHFELLARDWRGDDLLVRVNDGMDPESLDGLQMLADDNMLFHQGNFVVVILHLFINPRVECVS